MRESRDACAASVLRAPFSSSFSVRDVKRGRRETVRKDFVVPLGCDSCRIEDANLLLLHLFKRE